VRRIDGDIVGDDTAWVYRPYATGWAQDDLAWEYGAPVGALTLNDSSIEATLRPGSRAGEPAGITLQPAIEYFAIDNGVITVERGQGRIELDRMPGSRQIRLRGTIPLGGPAQTKRIAVDDPARFAAAAFYDALLRRGISVAGRAVAQHRFRTTATPSGERNPDAVVLAARISPPLADILQTLTKVSQNLYSETVLREVGRARRGNGSPEAGLAELHQFLTKADIRLDEYTWLDGSGLSRQNLVSPAAVTKLLVYMHNSPNRDLWKSLLPVAGEDGTLRYRFQEALLGQRVRAKTGTLAHVSALSGYAVREGADEVVFSILVNNHESPDSEIRSLIDKIVVAICQ
jgi:D-alanyl-D-alanine carboxypeptidase/D-alanyl-D-alanine-endopeptidase (penicillin-binding protein 4)